MSLKTPKKVYEKMSGMAWDIHEKLKAAGLNVWGVVVSGEDNVEIYFSEPEETETRIVETVKNLKELSPKTVEEVVK